MVFEFVEFEEVHVVPSQVGVFVVFLAEVCWSKEDLNHDLGVFVAVDSETVGEWFVVETELSGLDVEDTSFLEALNGNGVVDGGIVVVEEGDEFVNMEVLDLDSGVVQFVVRVVFQVLLVTVQQMRKFLILEFF